MTCNQGLFLEKEILVQRRGREGGGREGRGMGLKRDFVGVDVVG